MATNPSKNAASVIRSFLAVDLPHDVRSRCIPILAELAPHRDVLKLVAPESLHITVKFLGPVALDRLKLVESAVGVSAAGFTHFTLRLSGVGTFPGGKQPPRVVWIGLEDDAGFGVLRALHASVEKAVSPLGFPPEQRPFSPHLTLARVREGTDRSLTQQVGETVARLSRLGVGELSFRVSELTLFRSDLAPTGPRYTSLARLPLGDTAHS